MAVNYRYQPDGSKLAPRRGKPPPCPLDFVRDTGDPFHFIPILVDCSYRTKKASTCTGCGGGGLFCAYGDIRITYATCVGCKADPDEYFS